MTVSPTARYYRVTGDGEERRDPRHLNLICADCFEGGR